MLPDALELSTRNTCIKVKFRFSSHKTETTQWDHPKMTDLYHQLGKPVNNTLAYSIQSNP